MPKAAWLFLTAWLIYSASPPFPSFDSYWTIPVALNMLQHGRTDIDNYIGSIPKGAEYTVECDRPGERGIQGYAQACAAGHWYSWYPLAVSALVLPMVAMMKLATLATAPIAGLLTIPQLRSFFSGDLVGGRALAELWCAALIGALAVCCMYLLLKRLLPGRASVLLTLLFALGTSEWSTGTRSLLQHGSTVLMLTVTLYWLVLGREEPRWIARAALPLAALYTLRPSNGIAVLLVSSYVALHKTRLFPRFIAWSLPVAVPFLAYNLIVRHSLLPSYFLASEPYPRESLWTGFAVDLFSPSRGLIVFTPVFVFSFIGIYLAWRTHWRYPLTVWLSAILIIHTVTICLLYWWPGHCYGPRYFTDTVPLFIFFMVPAIQAWRTMTERRRHIWAGVFAALAFWGVFVHARGATSLAANFWSAQPVNVDDHKERVWDWSDPQFLRGLLR